MYGIGRAEAARFERPSKCFERPSKVLRATQQKGVGAVSVTVPQTVYFRPHGSRGASDLRITLSLNEMMLWTLPMTMME